MATKFGWDLSQGAATGTNSRPEHIREVADASLRRLGVDHIAASGIWRLAEAREGSRRKNCASEDQDSGGCDLPSPIQEPKWKSWNKGFDEVFIQLRSKKLISER